MRSLSRKMLGPYSVPAAGRLVRLLGQQGREVHLLRPRGGHLLAHHLLHLGQHAQTERQPGVDAGRGAADVAGAHEQPVAGDLGVDRVLTQGAEEELGEADEHGRSLVAQADSLARHCAVRHDGPVPELPEVEALAQFLRGRMDGHAVTEVSIGAISALKTFPAPRRSRRRHRRGRAAARQVAGRHGRDPHGRAPAPDLAPVARGLGALVRAAVHQPRPAGKSPLALRVRLGRRLRFDLTEAGTRKRLAVHVVEDPSDVPQIATLGVEPLSDEFTEDRLADLLAARNQQVKGLLRDQGTIAGIGNAYSDEILPGGAHEPFAMTRSFDADRTRILWEAIREVLTGAVQSASGKPATELKDAKRRGMKVHGRTGATVPGVERRALRRHRPRGLVRRLLAAVLPHVPDRRQAAGRPPDVPAAALEQNGRVRADLAEPTARYAASARWL